MLPRVEQYINRAALHMVDIPEERRRLLEGLARLVSSKRGAGEQALLTFICTHNSRRSQMGQLWAAAAAAHFEVDGVRAFSGGTEVTAFNPRAVAAMKRAGFRIEGPEGDNPHYLVTFSEDVSPVECFSKVYDDPFNPKAGFAAIMTCSEVDEACPMVRGADMRVSLSYEDPKLADGTSRETAAYDERCLQIAAEMLYSFSRVT